MSTMDIDKKKLRSLFTPVKHKFNERFGAFTHKRISDDWYYHSMAFVTDDFGYVFGFNIGLFRIIADENYDMAGMNIVLRTNGRGAKHRKTIEQFFRENLPDQIATHVYSYSGSDRGGAGVVFPMYRKITKFTSQNQLVAYLDECIEAFRPLLVKMVEDESDLFNDFYRAQRPWDEYLKDFVL